MQQREFYFAAGAAVDIFGEDLLGTQVRGGAENDPGVSRARNSTGKA